jgi:type IV pilus assembly protein PilC
MHIELPLLTKIILGMSNFVRHHVILLLLGIVALVYGTVQALRLPQGKRCLDWTTINVPVFRHLFINLQLAQFTRGLATLLSTGVPILASLEIMERSASNGVYAKSIGEAKEAVREGKPMVQSLDESGLFPAVMVQMVQVGEEIGELPKMLDRSAVYFEERVNVFIDRMTSLFEPIAIVVMGLVIGTLVISMFLPIFSMSTGAQQM